MTRHALGICSFVALTAPLTARADEFVVFAGSIFTLGASTETYWQWNFDDPSNGLTAFRGFDDRHDTFALQNAVLDLQGEDGVAFGRVALQTGLAPAAYYAPADRDLWRHLQQAYGGVKVPSADLTFEAGLMLSPIGPESLAAKDGWTWSRSTPFFALPFYHLMAHAAWQASGAWTLTFMICNGWNDAVDGNDQPSVSLRAGYANGALTAQLLYFGGVERPDGDSAGTPWRHLADAFATWQATPELAVQAHVDGGFEDGDLGLDAWVAGALAARLRVRPNVYVAARADLVAEDHPDAASVLLPVAWVGSGTLTLDVRPAERASLRLEYRHDHAAADLFFGGQVAGDGVATPYMPNRASQDTLTLGLVVWMEARR